MLMDGDGRTTDSWLYYTVGPKKTEITKNQLSRIIKQIFWHGI